MVMFYFSGTGNSKFIAQKFSEEMSCESFSIEENQPFRQMIKKHKTIGFCYPIYGSRVPRLMRQFVKRFQGELKGKKLIVFCTQLMFSGDGARAFLDLLPKEHCKVIYAEHFNMPNNISDIFIFPITSDEHNAKQANRALKKLKKVCSNIRIGKRRLRGFHVLSRCLGMTQALHWPKIERSMADKIRIDESCTKCGLCVKICPVKNLRMEEHGVETNEKCMCCYRCINQCPQKAIYGLIGGKVEKQYKGIEKLMNGAQ